MEYGIRIGCLGLGVDFLIVWIHGNPGSAGGKTGLGSVVPLHGGSGVIPAFVGDTWPEFFMG